jgi:hypothetical protein
MWYKRLSPVTGMLGYSMFKFHQERQRAKPTYKYDNPSEMLKVVRAIFKEIFQGLIYSDNGVFLKGIGYFAIWKSPVKKLRKSMKKGKLSYNYNYHTDGYAYHPTLFTDIIPNSPFKGWTIDRAFTKPLKTALAKELVRGRKYKLRYSDVKAVFGEKSY